MARLDRITLDRLIRHDPVLHRLPNPNSPVLESRIQSRNAKPSMPSGPGSEPRSPRRQRGLAA